MPTPQLAQDMDFTVKESPWINFAAGGLLLLTCIASWVYFRLDMSVTIILLPAIFFIAKGFNKQPAMTVNKQGIYKGRALVTEWENFVKAYCIDEQNPGSISDDHAIMVEYTADGTDGTFRTKIKLTSSQDKTEEEILEAISYFSMHHLQ